MSSEVPVTFRQQLEDMSNNLEHCKLERQRRHSEFTSRFVDIVARHERLTSCRLRRLSMEGILIDINSIKTPARAKTFHSFGNTTMDIHRDERDHLSYVSAVINSRKDTNKRLQKLNMNDKETSNEEATEKLNTADELQQHASNPQFKLEFSFDCRNPKSRKGITANLHNFTTIRTKALIDLDSGVLNKQKIRRVQIRKAITKVVNIQRLTTPRHQAVLSLAPIDIGEISNVRNANDHGRRLGRYQTNRHTQSQRYGSPRLGSDQQRICEQSKMLPRTLYRMTLRRAVTKLESLRKFEKLHKSLREK